MKHDKFNELIQFARVNNTLTAVNNYTSLLNELNEGDYVFMKTVDARDLSMHRAYFAFLSKVYDYMPERFKRTIARNIFYKFLQTLKGEYKVLFEFKDGRQLLDYESISFGRMNESKFRIYIKDQLPFIYNNLICEFYNDSTSDKIINEIEQEFEKYLTKLFAK